MKPTLDDMISDLNNKFNVTDIKTLKAFLHNPIQTVDNFGQQFIQITDMINEFLNTKTSEAKNKIDVFRDEEIDDFESIAIECYIKGATSIQCIQWTDEIISKIIDIDKKMLNLLQIEIIPHE